MNYSIWPYIVEYAPVSKARCKSCNGYIEKDALKFSSILQSTRHDGPIYRSHHFECFFKEFRPKTTAEFGHFDNLRWTDQILIEEKLDNFETFNDFGIGYTGAVKDRSKCSGCIGEIVQNGSMIVFQKDYESNVAIEYGVRTLYYHFHCFELLRKQIEFFESGERLPGFVNLEQEDQQIVRRDLPKIDQEEEGPRTKRFKSGLSNHDNREKRKSQNVIFWTFREELSRLKSGERKLLLRTNGQSLPESGVPTTLKIIVHVGIEKLRLDLLADAMAFGALIPCDKQHEQVECRGQLVYQSGLGYKCIGARDWGQCNAVHKNPKRSDFQIPSELREKYSFLDTYRPREETREIKFTVRNIPKPLADMELLILGDTLDDRAKLEKEISHLGGKISTRIHENLVACISNLRMSQAGETDEEIRKLKDLGIEVVMENFINRVKRSPHQVAEIIEKQKICAWGNHDSLRTRMAISQSREGNQLENSSVPNGNKVIYVKGGGVDPRSNLEDEACVHKDEREAKYTVTLGGIDVHLRKNDYYKMQVLKSKRSELFWFFRSWGRIGESIGGHKSETFDLAGCVDCFKEFYLEKSGNEWHTERFVKVPNKRYPIGIDYGDAMMDKLIETEMRSELDEPVQNLIKLIFNTDLMKQVILKYEIDLTIMPLGKLAEVQINKAYDVLNELQTLVITLINDETNPAFVDATNKFYTFIPHALQIPYPDSLLNTREKIYLKAEILDSLKNLNFNYELLNAYTGDSKNPYDHLYELMNVQINVLDKDSKEFKSILRYAKNSHGTTHKGYNLEVEHVFLINQHDKEQHLDELKKIQNHQLLWHGSSTTNFPSILSRGLQIAPPGVTHTGAMFGQGIYFADRVSKSARYCHTSDEHSVGLLLLCDVALGNMVHSYAANFNEMLPEGSHSRKGLGKYKPDPSEWCEIDGVLAPLGRDVVADSCTEFALTYNEYIVYNEAQVRLKYLVQFKKTAVLN